MHWEVGDLENASIAAQQAVRFSATVAEAETHPGEPSGAVAGRRLTSWLIFDLGRSRLPIRDISLEGAQRLQEVLVAGDLALPPGQVPSAVAALPSRGSQIIDDLDDEDLVGTTDPWRNYRPDRR